MNRKNLVDLLEVLSRHVGIPVEKLKDMTDEEIDILIEELEKLPPDQPIIEIKSE